MTASVAVISGDEAENSDVAFYMLRRFTARDYFRDYFRFTINFRSSFFIRPGSILFSFYPIVVRKITLVYVLVLAQERPVG